MAVTYQDILHDVGLRMNALVGTQVAALAATYDTAVLTAANFKSADWPFTSFRDAILMAEQQFATAITNNRDHEWRQFFAKVTVVLQNESRLPSLASDNTPIIGRFGSVYDSGDGQVLVDDLPLATVRRLADESWRVHGVYKYKIDADRIYHTRTPPGVIIDCCGLNQAAQLAAFAGGGNILLPDALRGPLAALAVTLMVKHTFMNTAAEAEANIAAAALAAIAAGKLPETE